MTSEQIKSTPAADLSTNSWLKELCFQVALLNEPSMEVEEKRKPGRPKKVA